MKPGADSSEQSLEYAEGRKERGDGGYLSRSLLCFQRFFLTWRFYSPCGLLWCLRADGSVHH